MASILIAGCGYVGTRLARTLQQQGHEITVIVQSDSSNKKLQPLFQTLQIDLDSTDNQHSFDQYDTVFYLVPPPSKGVVDTRLRHFLANISVSALPETIVLISTTGVYGDCGDDWIDETRQALPLADRAKRRYSAEQSLQTWCEDKQVRYRILRVPGIYGPGKLPVARLREQKPVLSLQESPWSNRIHVADLVQACVCAMQYEGKHTVFNIIDGHPSSMSDFFIRVAKAFNLPEPKQISLDECKQIFTENMISYLTESKRINNLRMLQDLQVDLKYPSLEEGLVDSQAE